MELVPMTDVELAAFREHTITNFTSEKARSENLDTAEARQAAEDAWEKALERTPEAHVMGRLEVDGESVGVMWFVVRPEWGQPCLWLYDIMIEPEHRGKGLGRRAMELLESEAKERGVAAIGLHVFGHNEVARSLYESLGFRATSIVMRKEMPAS